MGLLTAIHCREVRRYIPRLAKRAMLSPCPDCGAKRGAPCVRQGPDRRRVRVAWVHWTRKIVAKHEGFVMGLKYKCRIRALRGEDCGCLAAIGAA